MEYRTLGNTGTVVSTLCLGTMTFGAESDEKVAHEQLDRFLEEGGNFVDTADVYADGESETIVGRWLGVPGRSARPGGDRHQRPLPQGRGTERGRAVPGRPDPGAGGKPGLGWASR